MEELSLHILDIVHNSLEAGASEIDIEIHEDLSEDRLSIRVRDNGRGMDPETAARATDAFFTTRTGRGVGLGLPLIAAASEAAGGGLTIDSQPGCGTTVLATFRHGHVDRVPLGDLEATLMVLLSGQPGKDVFFRHQVEGRVFELDSRDFCAANIGVVSPSWLAVLRKAIRQGESELRPSSQ
jgi:anti-sigma regulatory factor (Ser/Thr protein kinase)